MSDKPVTVAVATYADRDSAIKDYEAIRHVKRGGQIDHLAIAVVEKDADGQLKIDRHDTSAHHLAWGGAVLGATLAVFVPVIGFTTLVGTATSAGVLAGAGGIIGHFHRNIPKATIEEMDKVLQSGAAGLVVVAVNPKGADIDALLAGAVKKVVTNEVANDKDATVSALEAAFEATDVPDDAPADAAETTDATA
ncbi:hypothetical protein [Microbacterium candidum]|uniref:DUF1269 domain-containing protein n=1 Tax=Microbacterium candidum TaxID=3041922 RepID=A0ABT7N372_9MICO|nr:hypothetical protein [Microbacterium sp. ASV49]MDL9981121.1 hypothetical protein [Microbacterium sp. ASV49]